MDFSTYDQITLRPKDYKVEYTFDFPACSGVAENDGFLPVSSTITAVSATAFNEAGAREDNLIVGTPTVSNNIVTISLQYPGAEGRYSLRFVLSEALGVSYEADFESIFCFA